LKHSGTASPILSSVIQGGNFWEESLEYLDDIEKWLALTQMIVRRMLVVYEVLETEPVIVIRPVTAYEPMPE
jgi:hypothetical protein